MSETDRDGSASRGTSSAEASPSMNYVGRPLKRTEDPRLITGCGQYVEDITLPGLAHLAFLRSPHAHARVSAIRTDAARMAPGVLRVVTAKDLGSLRPLPFMAMLPGLKQVPCAYLAASVVNATGEELTLWLTTQNPFLSRADLAAVLGFPEHRLRVIAPDVGGGFGVKGPLYREEIVAAVLARQLGRPIRWMSTRTEDLLTTIQARAAVTEAEGAVTADGELIGLRGKFVFDLGAHLLSLSLVPPMSASTHIFGPYRIQNAELLSVGVYTNSAPTGPYRGSGRPVGVYVIERLMDEAARVTGLDPVEIRRRNFIGPDAFPHRTPFGVAYDSGNYARALDRVLELADYATLRREQATARARGELMGIGVATYVESTNVLGWESGVVRVERSGKVTAVTGSSPHGQGHETTFAQIIADHLGVPLDHVG